VPIRLVAVVSDLHAGSDTGLMPKGFHLKSGNEIGLNKVQQWLLESWEDCWKWFYKLAGTDEWAFIANGDLIDGYHHGTTEVFSNDESDHGIAAYHLLKPIALKADAVFLTEGTEVHTHGWEHTLAYQLDMRGANVKRPSPTSGAWNSLKVKFAGTLCKFDHHISATARPNLEASALSIHMGAEREEHARTGKECPKVFGRAHRHKYGSFDDGYGLMFISPPWQAKTRYGHKFSPHGIPQVGMVVLDWRHVEDGDTPVLHRRLHTIKQPPPVKL